MLAFARWCGRLSKLPGQPHDYHVDGNSEPRRWSSNDHRDTAGHPLERLDGYGRPFEVCYV